MTKSKKTIIALSCISAALVLAVIVILSIFLIKDAAEKKENKKIAANVIAHIEVLDDSAITLEKEVLIQTVKAEYDLLTDKQKSYVTNHEKLVKATNDLQQLKDKKVADDFIEEINKINKQTLLAEDTSVEALLAKYDKLTDEQKALITNYNLLTEYKKLVEGKRIGKELAENFTSFDGKWGDFGAHVNKYQGIVEKALHNEATYTKKFSTPLNSLNFHISRFEKNSEIFGMGICYFSFYGTDKKTGHTGYLYGEIIIKEDGSLICTTTEYYCY